MSALQVIVAVVTLASTAVGLWHWWQRRRIEARKNLLLRTAHDIARSSHATLQFITLELTSRLDMRAARALEKEGRGTVDGDRLTLEIDRTPRLLQRAIAQRATYSPRSSHYADDMG